ncbi:MAG: tripartite tricarboxylate transporter substrate binding protein [Burkholderiales bacterium]|nr:tripartite tricarboxylate transporter substrate binding protein [Burkholderiales bacterium]MCE7876225.1 tripartite tricarboxylate transporter substrate binding protein [Betaproteobacteria bacterium PRO3]
MQIIRWITRIAVAAALATAFAAPAIAQDWPGGKTVQIIVPAPGGGGTGDTIARVIAEELGKHLKTSVIIDNKPGANGNIGAAYAAQQSPDGYKLLFSWAGTLAVNPSLYKGLSYNAQKDFVPIVLIADVPNILVVNNDVPAKTLSEFIAYAKANPGKLNFGSTGNGSSMHLAGELFMRETGAKMVHVPYNAPGTATTNLMAGDIQLMFQLIPGIAGQVKGGKVRPIAVMADKRSPALPDVPTTVELGAPKLLSSTWFALLAPKGTPAPIVDKLNAAVNEILKDPAVKKRLADMGATTLGGTPTQLAEHLAAETAKWGNVVRAANIQIQ